MTNLNNKAKPKWILVVVVKCRHRPIVLLSIYFLNLTFRSYIIRIRKLSKTGKMWKTERYPRARGRSCYCLVKPVRKSTATLTSSCACVKETTSGFQKTPQIDFFSLYVFFFHFRSLEGTPENCFFLCHSRAYVYIIYEKTKLKFPWEHNVVWIGKTKHTSYKGLLWRNLRSGGPFCFEFCFLVTEWSFNMILWYYK